MAFTWLPPRRYAIPARAIATARGVQGPVTGTLFSCSDGIFTGWSDAPDAATHRGHRVAVESFAREMADLHLRAQQHGVTLAQWLHRQFPQWTLPPRETVELQALCDFAQLRADPHQDELRALGLTWLKVKLTGEEALPELRATLEGARELGWRLRLDVNGGWQRRADVSELLATCGEVGVEYVEDPVSIADFPASSAVAIAADAIDSSVRAVVDAALSGRCQTVVAKPPLWGKVAAFLADVARLQDAGVGVVLSSSFDSAVGLAQLAELASILPLSTPCGLATHLLWQRDWQPPALAIRSGHWSLQHSGAALAPQPIVAVHAHADGRLQPIPLGQQHRQSGALAARLAALGVAPGTRVATWADNTPEALVAWRAVQMRGGTWMPLHPRLTPSEARRLIERAQPRVLLCDQQRARNLVFDNCIHIDLNSFAQFQQVSDIPESQDPEGISALLFTSGSTGLAKGVQLSARALAAAADAALQQFGPQPGAHWLCCLPLCHVAGLLILERAQRLGMTVILAEQPSTSALASLLHTLPPRLASLVPTQLMRLLDAQVQPPPGLLAVLIGGAPCPPELVDRARAAGWPVLPSYGMTETAAQIATAPLATRLATTPWPRATAAVCVGPPMPGVDLAIRQGEILVRSAQLLSAYLDDASPLVDGWLPTGDLGTLDANGWLWVAGRRGELILRGGENITPDEVEAVLLAIPGVREACVVGVPDRVLGQRVGVWLTVTTPIAQPALQDHLQVLAAFKRPEIWLQTAKPLPRTGPGKVARARVRERLAQQ